MQIERFLSEPWPSRLRPRVGRLAIYDILIQERYETLAILARHTDQRCLYIFPRASQAEFPTALGFTAQRELPVVDPRHQRLFYWSVGQGLAAALHDAPDQEGAGLDIIPDRLHRVHGQ